MAQHPLFTAIKPLLEAVGAKLVHPDQRLPSDIPLVWDGTVVAGVRTPPLHGALDRLIELYTATNKPDEAARWRAERIRYPFVAPPPRPVTR